MSSVLDGIIALSLNTPPSWTTLSPESVCFLLFAQQVMSNPAVWLNNPPQQNDSISPADADKIDEIVSNCIWEIMHPLIGVILPYATQDPPSGTLACDGSVYLRVNYPELYAQIDTAFIIDADSFFVPDLQGKVIIGESGSHAIATDGGAETVTLSTGEIPSHTHTNSPHTHTEATAAPNVTTIGAGAPQPTAIPSVGVTGASSVIIDSTGGDGAHENMQPYLTLRYCIGAG